MASKSARTALVISTICIACIDIAVIMEYINTGDPGGIVSSLCFFASTICMAVGWIHYFLKQKQR